jgi:hypothetical protein
MGESVNPGDSDSEQEIFSIHAPSFTAYSNTAMLGMEFAKCNCTTKTVVSVLSMSSHESSRLSRPMEQATRTENRSTAVLSLTVNGESSCEDKQHLTQNPLVLIDKITR